VFALLGVAAGTMRVEEFVRLQVYIYSYIAIALLLSLWVLPGLVTVLLPISYRKLMRSAQNALITAFALALLIAGTATSLLQIQRAAMIRYLLITGAIIVVVLGGLRVFYEYVLPHECEQNERFRGMQLATEPVKFTLREAIPEGDYVRSKFSSREAVKALVKPRIGVLNVQYYVDTLQSYLPQAEIVKLNSPGDFFEGRSEEFDALFLSADRGSVWTLIHPEFSVAIPQPDVLAAPVSIAMARDAESLAEFINAWLRLKREDQTINQLYKYWILGGGAEPLQPRWSVIRDVLAWVD
jgi:hypothetical protein